MKVYLIRECLNKGGKLTNEGRLQAELVKHRLREIQFDAVYHECDKGTAEFFESEELTTLWLHKSINKKHKNVAVIGESSVLRVIMRWMLGCAPVTARGMVFSPASITIIEAGDEWELVRTNDFEHLRLMKEICQT